MQKLIAVVGQAGSGKDTAANYIAKKYDYKHISTADILREYITSKKLGNLTRRNMSEVVEKLRIENGNAILVKMALKNEDADKIVLSALRNPEESRLVKELGGVLIDTKADLKSRYKRNKKRSRQGDSVSFEEFKNIEDRENTNKNFGINEVEAMSDYTLNNNGTYEDFYAQLDEIINSIENK